MQQLVRRRHAPARMIRVGTLFLIVAVALALGVAAAASRTDGGSPSVSASIDFNWVSLQGWTPGGDVSLDVGGVPRTVTVDGGGNAFLDNQTLGQDLAVGTTITATQGATTKTLTLAGLRITSVVIATDVVSGTAPAGAAVHISINQPSGPPLGQADTTADADGAWSVDFTGSVDLGYGMFVSANVTDDDGDTTFADRQLQLPFVGASITNDWISLNNWTPGSTVELGVGGAPTSVTVDGYGNANVQRSTHGQDVVAGMTITATDGATAKELLVADVRITAVNLDTDTISGIAPAGATLYVGVSTPGSPQPVGSATVTVGGDGTWSVTFAEADVTSGMGVVAILSDPDSDQTFAERFLQTPRLFVHLEGDGVNLNGWTPGGSVHVVVGSFEQDVTVDGNGNAMLLRDVHGQDIVAGMTITASEGSTTKTLVVADLRITSIDISADSVGGIAPAGATVFVNVGVPGNPQPVGSANVTAGPDGTWSVDFTASLDVTFGMNVSAMVNDTDGDGTGTGRSAFVPTVHAAIPWDGINLNNWTPGSTVDVNVGGVVRTVTIDAFGNASLDRQAHGQDVVPGMTITATDGTTTKTLVVADLSVATVDLTTETVAGTAPARAMVFVSVNVPGSPQPIASANVQAGDDGGWSVAFTGVDLTLGMGANASVTDADGDTTGAGRFLQVPWLDAGSDWDVVLLFGWTAGSTVHVTLGGLTHQVTVDGEGMAMLGPEVHGHDIVPGTTITATDGTTTKTLVVADLSITSLDPDTDSVSGIAPAGATVWVGVNALDSQGPLANTSVTAGEDGTWSVSFAGSVDITFGMGAFATVNDLDGDGTTARAFLQRPFVGAWLLEDGVSLHAWTPGSTVDVQVGAAALSVTVDESGSAWIDAATHGQDLVPGTTITATDGTTAKTLVVTGITVTSVDTAADTVSGTAAPGVTLGVAIWQPPTEEPPLGWLSTEADDAGNWSVGFSGLVDVTASTAVTANVADADGDMTNMHRMPGGPTVEAGGPYTLAEGTNATLQGSADGTAPLTFLWSGAGDELRDPTSATTGFAGLDDGPFELTLVATDADGMTGSDETTVTVTNLAPQVSAANVRLAQRNAELTVRFVDRGRLDTHTVLVRWGDGSDSVGVVREKNGAGLATASHTYAKGTYTVTVTVTDDDGGAASATRQVVVR